MALGTSTSCKGSEAFLLLSELDLHRWLLGLSPRRVVAQFGVAIILQIIITLRREVVPPVVLLAQTGVWFKWTPSQSPFCIFDNEGNKWTSMTRMGESCGCWSTNATAW
mmetsp:Transcript_44820/g.105515  ORF Transcript_44820/g.105515 Transcript_44820/m.105515 type:complete len:109 (+) Transcript_44820:1270-1596(+)